MSHGGPRHSSSALTGLTVYLTGYEEQSKSSHSLLPLSPNTIRPLGDREKQRPSSRKARKDRLARTKLEEEKKQSL